MIRHPMRYSEEGFLTLVTFMCWDIHNHNDHLGKFDVKADDGYFLGYSLFSKAFRVFNTKRQQSEETYHVTFDENIEVIRFSNTSVDEIRINDSSRYPPEHEESHDSLNTKGANGQNASNEHVDQSTKNPNVQTKNFGSSTDEYSGETHGALVPYTKASPLNTS
ncbi:hypothetical protein Tco_0670595 [Tanacetum coccineum]